MKYIKVRKTTSASKTMKKYPKYKPVEIKTISPKMFRIKLIKKKNR